MSNTGWQVIGKSVRGASHVRSGLPNQDAIRWAPKSSSAGPLVVALADGHGSAACFRSNVGARLATRVAVDVCQAFLGQPRNWDDLAQVHEQAVAQLPRALEDRWRAAVEDHLRGRPFAARELNALEQHRGQAARLEVQDNRWLVYGTTLLTLAASPSCAILLQLGDGDILSVSAGGQVQRAVPRDARLLGNATTSMCTEAAWKHFRVATLPLTGDAPVMLLLATDGYANSFRDDRDFLQVGSDLLDVIRREGAAEVSRHLEGWLDETSRDGSGDDISLGIVYRRA